MSVIQNMKLIVGLNIEQGKEFAQLKLKLFIIAGLSIILFSCNTYHYVPNAQNIPLLTHEDDLKLMASYSSDLEYSGIDLQYANALSNKSGLLINFNYTSTSAETEWDEYTWNLYFLEVGYGKFKKLTETSVFEFYGLAGIGFTNPEGANLTYSKLSMQLSYGHKSNWFEFAISSRFSGLNYHNVPNDYVYYREYYDSEYDYYSDMEVYLKDQKFSFLIEPALTLRAGAGDLKFQLQYIRSFNLSHTNFDQVKNYVSFGIIASLSKK